MTDQNEAPAGASAARGEAAWKAHKEAIANRNQKVRKEGKAQRLEHERRIEAQRRAAGR